MTEIRTVEEFLEETAGIPVLDARSPSEYAHAHLPGASNLPLLFDEQRKKIGILYKQEGRDAAVKEGLSMIGPRMREMVEDAEAIAPERRVGVYCARGGMRSQSLAWLLDLAGFDVVVLQGGYKAFRGWVLRSLKAPWPLIVLGGMTGSGKTDILHELSALGEQVLDLEGLGRHKGSAFGNLDGHPQPSTQQFENLIAMELRKMSKAQVVWVEDESRMVGVCAIQEDFFQQMRAAPLFQIKVSDQARIERLVKDYGQCSMESLVAAIDRITKRLGGERAMQVKQLLKEGNMAEAAALILAYYDKTYRFGLSKRDATWVFPIEVEDDQPTTGAKLVIERAKELGLYTR